MKYDDETLMAYVDGELDAKLRAEIAAAVENEPPLARRVEHHRALRARVTGAFEKVLDQPIPARLTETARGKAAPVQASAHGQVLQFPARPGRAPAMPWRMREWAAMAASLVLGAVISWRLFSNGEGPIVADNGALVARGALALALDRQLASEQRGEEPVLIGLSFKTRDGNYCRSFMLRAAKTTGLACRVGADWQVPVTDTSVIPPGEMQQASSIVTPAILRAIEVRGDGALLDAEAERSAQLAGWKAANQD